MKIYTYRIPGSEEDKLRNYLEDSNICKVEEHGQESFIFPGGKTKVTLRPSETTDILVDVRTSRRYFPERGLTKMLRDTRAKLNARSLLGRESYWLNRIAQTTSN